MDQLANAKTGSDEQQRYRVGNRIERLMPCGGAHGLFWNWLRRELFASDHIEADMAGATPQILHHRAAPEFEPQGARRLADDDLGHVIGLREADDIVGN